MSVISSVSVHKAQKNGKQELASSYDQVFGLGVWSHPFHQKNKQKIVLMFPVSTGQTVLCSHVKHNVSEWVTEWPTDQTTSVQLTKDVCGMSFLSDGLELVVTPAILPVAVPRMLHHLENRHKHAVQPSSFLGVHPSQIRAFVSEKTPSWGWGFPAQRRVSQWTVGGDHPWWRRKMRCTFYFWEL